MLSSLRIDAIDIDSMITTFNRAVNNTDNSKGISHETAFGHQKNLDLCDETCGLKRRFPKAEGAKACMAANKRVQKALKKAK